MRALFTLTMILFSTQVFANWPAILGNLPSHQLALVEGKQLAGFTPYDFKLLHQQSTVEPHAIITYGVEDVLVHCGDGIVAKNNHYISLYVNGGQIKHVTNFSNYGCHKD